MPCPKVDCFGSRRRPYFFVSFPVPGGWPVLGSLVMSGMSVIGSGAGVVAIVYPIHASIPSKRATARKAVIRRVHSHAQGRARSAPYTIIPRMLTPRIVPPMALSLAKSDFFRRP